MRLFSPLSRLSGGVVVTGARKLLTAGLVAWAAACGSERPPASAVRPDTALDQAARDAVIGGVLTRLRSSYLSRETAVAMERAIRARDRRGEYAHVTSARALADSLTAHLQAVSGDLHLRVRYSHDPLPPQPWKRGSATEHPDSARLVGRRARFGIGRPQRLAGNVGFLEIRSFAFDPSGAEVIIANAMTDLADAAALIIDVRRNDGGSPRLAAFLASYLFDGDPVHLTTLQWRGRYSERLYTRPDVPGRRFGSNRPVYLLTSRGTFSAAEGFAYNLQALRRVVVVGDTTGGGAHAGGLHRVTDHFGVWVPAARPVNPITGRNWERVGVRPDLAVPADSAKAAAHRAALWQILAHAPDAESRARLEETLRDLVPPPAAQP